MRNNAKYLYVGLAILTLILIWLDLSTGSVWLNIWDTTDVGRRIWMEIRLPKMLTALLAGAALSVSGLMMQTLFRNPLAGPYILGVSSGASLGVALLTMVGVGSMAGLPFAAIVGSVAVLLLMMLLARRLRNNVSMLIVGMMVGSIAGAVVNLIQNFSNPEALKIFVVWTFGSLGSVGWREMMVLAPLVVVGLLSAFCLMKPMNGLLLGENYARALGMDVQRVRVAIVLVTGLLAGAVTAYCGPIAFVGVAVPHLARGLFGTTNHRYTLPVSAWLGANLLLLCDILSSLSTYPLPISTISALFGAPVVIWVILKK